MALYKAFLQFRFILTKLCVLHKFSGFHFNGLIKLK